MTKPLIALEVHDVSMWEPSRIGPLEDVLSRWGYNALVLHQNDLLDSCTQIGLSANYGVSDLRLKKVRNNAAWLSQLAQRLGRQGAELLLEIKEPSFHDYAVELYPDLLGPDGRPDPSRPGWPAFCRAKTEDLLARVPDVGGLIITLSSPESRVSLPDFLAASDSDQNTDAWFDRMIAAFREPLVAAGKALYIRDFSYTTEMQSDALAAVNRCGGTVGASVKITAHDYFPEYPQNPVATMVDGPLLFEFEAFGEHMGWGVIPNCRVGEFRDRMAGCRACGTGGLLMRTSWEAITGVNALDTLSAVNVYALPRMIDADVDPTTVIVEWLRQVHGIAGDLAEHAADLMLRSWQIPVAAYWQGRVFPRHSCLPSTWQEGWLSMTTDGMGRRNWSIEIDADDPLLSDPARTALFSDKDRAVEEAEALAIEARHLYPMLPEHLARQFGAFAWLPAFACQFELATKATFYAARGNEGALAEVQALRPKLLDLARQIETRLNADPDLPHHHRVLFDPEQIRRFTASLPLP